jgi:sugar lactone lactonase YvrE
LSPSRATTIVLEGLCFPEGPRWRDGRLYFSDQHDHRVVAMEPSGAAETIVEVPQQPSGLGWLPDGRMLVVSMLDRRVMRLEDGSLVEHADLSRFAPAPCNDMVVDAQGRAYVGHFGFDMYGGEGPKDASLLLVRPDGTVAVAAEPLQFPNGTVITPDGATLIVGESMRGRLTAFTITADGSLTDRREFAQLQGAVPDGICLDAEGAVWIACPLTGRCLRVQEGGAVLDEVKTSHEFAFACMLGGDDRRTLYICTAPTHVPSESRTQRGGRIEAVEVDVPGAGLP